MKNILTFAFIILITWPFSKSFARVQVAFFETYYRNGQRVELTEGGLYYHVAIKAAGKWYHALPRDGVTVLQSLNTTPGLKIVEILENNDLTIRYKDMKPYLNLPFDYKYHWHDAKSTYCSKFIAQLLGVEPRPMNFSTRHWRKSKDVDRSGVGVSPDYLFEALLEKGFEILPLKVSKRKRLNCQKVFAH